MRQALRLFFIVAVVFLTALPLFSQNEVPWVVAEDDSFPSLRSVFLDPSNHKTEFHGSGFFDVFTELSLDLTPGGNRIWPQPGFFSFSGSATVRSGSGLHKDLPLEITVQFGPGSNSGSVTTFQTEMLSLNLSGTTFMLRESPTRASTGKTALRESPTRPQMNSFFDVFLELSVDGGGTWMPADDSVRIEMKIKPTILINRPDPPPIVAGRCIGDLDRDGIPDLVLTLLEESQSVPVDSVKFKGLQAGFDYYISGSRLMASPGHATIGIKHTFDDGDTQFFDTEMLQMDISGGALPSGVMVRESPSKASLGRTSIRTMPDGHSAISSFFDIFTELSVDGGQSWTPQPPVSLELREPLIPVVPTVPAPDNSFPVVGSVMLDPSNRPVSFNSFFDVFTEVTLDFTGTAPVKPPLPGASQNQSMTGVARFHLSLDGGATIQIHTCPVDAMIRMASASNSGDTRFFDTEMLSLNLSGGSLPSGVMIRESPTKQSLGQHVIRESPSRPTHIGSFFDVFFELSVDGGGTWMPADAVVRLETKTMRAPVNINTASVPVLSSGAYQTLPTGDPDFDLLRITHNTLPPPPPPPVGSSATFPLSVEIAGISIGGVERAGSGITCIVRATSSFSDGTTSTFDTEMLQLDLSGGTLPSGIMVRESPSKASLGKTSARALSPGLFEVSSFFDVFTELSIDGGQTWTPQEPMTLEFADSVRESPSLSSCLPVATYPNDLFPFPGAIVHPSGASPQTYLTGSQFRYHQWRWVGASGLQSLPPLGVTNFYNDILMTDMQMSPGPGLPFQDVVASGPVLVRMTHSVDDGTTRHFDTEMLSLNLTSSLGVMIRESPTLPSLGHTTVKPNGSGYTIDSFFDIFTEISFDGGSSWIPSNGPTHLVQELFAPELPISLSHFPPPGVYKINRIAGEQCDNGLGNLEYDNGARIFRPAFFDIFTEAALPPPGGSSVNTFTARAHQSISLDGGNSFFDVFFDVSGSIQCDATNNSSLPPDPTRYFDTEMLALNLQPLGGDLTIHGDIRLRESPTLPSKGKLYIRESPTLPKMSSFFDIFTEISLDGGLTWSPQSNAMRIELDTVKPGTITGIKWHDADGNGAIDGGETGLAGWKIYLTDTLGTVLDTTLTNGAGEYAFSNVPPGTYRVSEEGKAGWIQTGGAPAYGFLMVPGDTNKGNDFGNFQAPVLTGVKFNDHNGDGIRDPEDEGVADWEICLFPKNIQSPGASVNSGTGSFGLHLNGLPPGEPVLGTLTGYAAAKRGYDYYKAKSDLLSSNGVVVNDVSSESVLPKVSRSVLKEYFENGQIPTEMQALQLQSVNPVIIGGQPYTIKVKPDTSKPKKEYVGHVSIMKTRRPIGDTAPLSPYRSSFFDVFLELEITPLGTPGSIPIPEHLYFGIILEADLDGDGEPEPLSEGMVYNGGPVTLYDAADQPAGTLDNISFTVGKPASQVNPICIKTDADGQYNFSPLLPGVWNILEGQEPCWVATTGPVPPILSTSGVTLPPVDFGNHENKGTICVTKYYDINHNQQLDGGEPPMAGVEFILTGPSGSVNGVTDVNGNLCFYDLDSGDYALTETVPDGYTVSVPKSGVYNATVGHCDSLSFMWLNSAALTDTLFRTATAEDWARALDKKNKHKEEKCKPDKVRFKFNLRMRNPGEDHGERLTIKFNMPVDTVLMYARKNKVDECTYWTSVDPKRQIWQGIIFRCVAAYATDSVIQFDGIGLKGAPIKFTYQWDTIRVGGGSSPYVLFGKGALPGKPLYPSDNIKLNQLLLPMPNLNNVGQEIYAQGGFPIVVGAAQDSHSVTHLKYQDIQKSLYKDNKGILTLHTDSTRCLDKFITNQKTLLKQQKSLPPVKHNNALFAEALALKLNVIASRLGKFPAGLDSLIYDDHKNLLDPTHPVFNGKYVAEIMAQVDSMLACKVDPKGAGLTPYDYYRVIRKINKAFSGPIDTTRWSCEKLILTGVRPLKSVSYLRAEPGHSMMPETFPVNPHAKELMPSAFSLNQNYPNPFNPSTTIQFELPEEAAVTMKIYNMLGQEVATLINNEVLDEGETEVEFDASSLPSGVYLYKLTANGIGDIDEGIVGQSYVSVKKMMLIK